MRKILVTILSCVLLTACGKNQRDIADDHVWGIVNSYDWSKGVPLYAMIDAYHECEKYPDISWCVKLNNQLIDISVSYETCKSQSPQSKLCGMVENQIKYNPIRNILPTAEALPLPDNPCYFSLPTKLLEENASGNGYRSEMWDTWIQKYQSLLYKIIFGTMAVLILWLFYKFCRSEIAERKKAERTKIYRAQEVAEKKIRDDKIIQREAEIAAKQKADAEKIAKQNRLRESEQAERELRQTEERQKVAEAEAREAADKMLVEQMMKAAVKNLPKKK
jgi:hypothetical protein